MGSALYSQLLFNYTGHHTRLSRDDFKFLESQWLFWLLSNLAGSLTFPILLLNFATNVQMWPEEKSNGIKSNLKKPPALCSQDLIASSRSQWLCSVNAGREERATRDGHSAGLSGDSGKYKGGDTNTGTLFTLMHRMHSDKICSGIRLALKTFRAKWRCLCEGSTPWALILCQCSLITSAAIAARTKIP